VYTHLTSIVVDRGSLVVEFVHDN